jgi:hypothetical protein
MSRLASSPFPASSAVSNAQHPTFMRYAVSPALSRRAPTHSFHHTARPRQLPAALLLAARSPPHAAATAHPSLPRAARHIPPPDRRLRAPGARASEILRDGGARTSASRASATTWPSGSPTAQAAPSCDPSISSNRPARAGAHRPTGDPAPASVAARESQAPTARSRSPPGVSRVKRVPRALNSRGRHLHIYPGIHPWIS